MYAGDTHSLCVVCLGVRCVESALEGGACTRHLHSWGSQLDLMEGLETSVSLSPSSPIRSYSLSLRLEARAGDTSPWAAGSAIFISSSEEIDVESIDDVPSRSSQCEELVNVVTRAVAKLNIN